MFEPLPCPYCGAEKFRYDHAMGGGFIVCCNACGAQGPCPDDGNCQDDYQDALRLWNLRQPSREILK